MPNIVVSIDPGKYKSGLVLVDLDDYLVIEGIVTLTNEAFAIIKSWELKYPLSRIFIGNGTSTINWKKHLKNIAPIQILEERGSTLKARERYWELWPPKYFLRFIPRNLLLPKEELDAVAALVILENYIDSKLEWINKPNFRIVI